MRNQNLPKYHRAPLNSLEMEKSPGHACQECPELCNEHSPHFPRAFPPVTAIQSLATPCEVGEDHILRDTGSCLLNTMWPREAKVGNRPQQAACCPPHPTASQLCPPYETTAYISLRRPTKNLNPNKTPTTPQSLAPREAPALRSNETHLTNASGLLSWLLGIQFSIKSLCALGLLLGHFCFFSFFVAAEGMLPLVALWLRGEEFTTPLTFL